MGAAIQRIKNSIRRRIPFFRQSETRGPKADRQRIVSLKQDKKKLKNRILQLEDALIEKGVLRGVPLQEVVYNSDGICVWGKNPEFLTDERFKMAYRKGNQSGHVFHRDGEFHIEWRVHVVLWAAGLGLRLKGDFVECGVNTGIFSLAIADYYDFGESERQFFLFDTFCGTPEEQMSLQEREKCVRDNENYYPDCYEMVNRSFSPYSNMHLVQGVVPDSLRKVDIEKVAYLSIDMNVAAAELAAIEYFWDKLECGAPVVFDDYAWAGCEVQKSTLDDFASRMGTSILTLPTGQGLLMKV